MDRDPASNQPPSQALFRCEFEKIGSQRVKYIVDWKIACRGTKISGFELIEAVALEDEFSLLEAARIASPDE